MVVVEHHVAVLLKDELVAAVGGDQAVAGMEGLARVQASAGRRDGGGTAGRSILERELF